MKKIVVLENSFFSTVSMRRALMNALAQQGSKVYILSSGAVEFTEQLNSINAECIDIGSSNTNPIEIWKYLRRMYKTIKIIQNSCNAKVTSSSFGIKLFLNKTIKFIKKSRDRNENSWLNNSKVFF